MSAQFAALDLFAPLGPRTVVDDPEGGCVYTPGFIDAPVADAWFALLRDGVQWRQQRRPMYDRIVDVPRLTSGYDFDDPAMPPALGDAARRVRDHVGAPFTHIGLNHYRDGHDSVAPHNDKLSTLVAPHPIALLSLGSPRCMEIREKAPPRRVVRIELEPGSLLVMSHAMQRTHDHGIPKSKLAVGPRISLAFRVRPPKAE